MILDASQNQLVARFFFIFSKGYFLTRGFFNDLLTRSLRTAR